MSFLYLEMPVITWVICLQVVIHLFKIRSYTPDFVEYLLELPLHLKRLH